jgi:hypothetical protein
VRVARAERLRVLNAYELAVAAEPSAHDDPAPVGPTASRSAGARAPRRARPSRPCRARGLRSRSRASAGDHPRRRGRRSRASCRPAMDRAAAAARDARGSRAAPRDARATRTGPVGGARPSVARPGPQGAPAAAGTAGAPPRRYAADRRHRARATIRRLRPRRSGRRNRTRRRGAGAERPRASTSPPSRLYSGLGFRHARPRREASSGR